MAFTTYIYNLSVIFRKEKENRKVVEYEYKQYLCVFYKNVNMKLLSGKIYVFIIALKNLLSIR